MATSVSLTGVTNYSLPATGEGEWGGDTTSYLVAIASDCLAKKGGAFTLTADANFGANYGLVSKYFKSLGTVAGAGILRLANNETVAWRNAANNANITFGVDASDEWSFNGTALTTTELGYLAGVTSAIQDQLDDKAESASSQPLDADLTALAALGSTGFAVRSASDTWVQRSIAVGSSKLSLSNGDGISGNPTLDVVEANLALANISGTLAVNKGGTGATTANAALNALLPTQTSNAGKVLTTDGTDTSWAAALTSSLNQYNINVGNGSNVATAVNTNSVGDILADSTNGLTIKSGVIVNADIAASGSANIALNKLASTTASRALVTDASGYIITASVTSTELGYVSGVTSAIQTQLGTKVSTSGAQTVAGVKTFSDFLKVLIGGTVETSSSGVIGLYQSSATTGTNAYVKIASGSAGVSGVILGSDGSDKASLTFNSSTGFTILKGGSGNALSADNSGYVYLSQTLVSESAASLPVSARDSDGLLFYNSSSRRYKRNIVDSSYGLAEVLRTRAVDYSPTKAGDVFTGFIAEELHEIMPRFVTYRDGKPDGVLYAQITATLSKAMTELYSEFNKRIRALEAR